MSETGNLNAGIIPWADAMAFGLGVLRLSPNEFWTMTPRELNAALAGLYGPPASRSPLARRDLNNLMAKFPDE